MSPVKQSISIWLIKMVQLLGPRNVEVLGRTYEISKDVFNPKYYVTSQFMARNMAISKGDVVLDMGTGSGIQAITAGLMASKVIAVDINPEAVMYARKNADAHNLGNIITVVEGDLFSPLKPGILFNTILFTPPYMEGTPVSGLDHALFDRNKKLIARFFKEAGHYLKPDGNIQMLYSSIAGPDKALDITRHLGWKHSVIADKKTRIERFYMYKLSRI